MSKWNCFCSFGLNSSSLKKIHSHCLWKLSFQHLLGLRNSKFVSTSYNIQVLNVRQHYYLSSESVLLAATQYYCQVNIDLYWLALGLAYTVQGRILEGDGADRRPPNHEIYIVSGNSKGNGGVKYLIFHENVCIHPLTKKGFGYAPDTVY